MGFKENWYLFTVCQPLTKCRGLQRKKYRRTHKNCGLTKNLNFFWAFFFWNFLTIFFNEGPTVYKDWKIFFRNLLTKNCRLYYVLYIYFGSTSIEDFVITKDPLTKTRGFLKKISIC